MFKNLFKNLTNIIFGFFLALSISIVGAAIYNPIPGVNTNSNAAAGFTGEVITSQFLPASAVSLAATSAVVATATSGVNVTSVMLTPGDWDVAGVGNVSMVAVTTTQSACGSSATSAVLGTQDSASILPVSATAVTDVANIPLPTMRYSVATSTPVYLVCRQLYSAGTSTAYGTIRARRVR